MFLDSQIADLLENPPKKKEVKPISLLQISRNALKQGKRGLHNRFSSPKGAVRLLYLADFLETQVPEKRFDMEHWAGTLDNYAYPFTMRHLKFSRYCYTTGCALGWATSIFPELVVVNEEIELYTQYTVLRNGRAAAVFFYMDLEDAVRLFGTARENYKTPKQVARGLRRYVSDGWLPSTLY